jgi:methylmalonyl-CoA/ethylmalonyl-CoA epimerase
MSGTTATDASYTPATFGLDRIMQVAVLAHDIERATAFYRDVLGMRLLFAVPPRMAFFDCGGIRLMLSLPEGESGGTSILYYRVGDIHAAHETLTARGASFVDAPHLVARMPDHDLWLAEFRDSEGNVLALMSEVRPPAPR